MKRIFYLAVIVATCAHAEPRIVTMSYAEYTNLVTRVRSLEADAEHARKIRAAHLDFVRRYREQYDRAEAARKAEARRRCAEKAAAARMLMQSKTAPAK